MTIKSCLTIFLNIYVYICISIYNKYNNVYKSIYIGKLTSKVI